MNILLRIGQACVVGHLLSPHTTKHSNLITCREQLPLTCILFLPHAKRKTNTAAAIVVHATPTMRPPRRVIHTPRMENTITPDANRYFFHRFFGVRVCVFMYPTLREFSHWTKHVQCVCVIVGARPLMISISLGCVRWHNLVIDSSCIWLCAECICIRTVRAYTQTQTTTQHDARTHGFRLLHNTRSFNLAADQQQKNHCGKETHTGEWVAKRWAYYDCGGNYLLCTHQSDAIKLTNWCSDWIPLVKLRVCYMYQQNIVSIFKKLYLLYLFTKKLDK